MIYITGVRPQDKMYVARAIVRSLGVGGVCKDNKIEDMYKCAKVADSADCIECAVHNKITFIFDDQEVISK